MYITFLGVKYALKAKVSGGDRDGDVETDLFTVVSGPALDETMPGGGDGPRPAAPTAGN